MASEMGRRITDEINADPAEVARLRQARESASRGHLLSRDEAEDFYEDDEPLEEVFAAFDRGVKFVTAPPPGWQGPVRSPRRSGA